MSSTTARMAQVLEVLSDEPQTLSSLARHVQVHRSTMLRQLRTLEEAELVYKHSDGTYHIGAKLIRIGQKALESMELRTLAGDILRELSRKVKLTVHLAQLVGDQIIYVDRVEKIDSTVRIYSEVGRVAIPYCTGLGKAILSRLDSSQVDRLLRPFDFVKYTPTTLASRENLNRDLALSRERGWAEDDSEYEPIINCIAAPIIDPLGNPVGAISITSFKHSFPLTELRQHVPALQETCRSISIRIA